jgi:hypothetical protein
MTNTKQKSFLIKHQFALTSSGNVRLTGKAKMLT